MVKFSFITASLIFLICGIMHLHGTFFSTDLHPADPGLIKQLQTAPISMTPSGIMWKLWIGFNAMFAVGLIYIGGVMSYGTLRQYPLLCRRHFLIVLTIVSNAFFVWVGFTYMIPAFFISMLVPLVLFITGYIFILVSRAKTTVNNEARTSRQLHS